MSELTYLVYDGNILISAFRYMEDAEIFIAKRKRELPSTIVDRYGIIDLKEGRVTKC